MPSLRSFVLGWANAKQTIGTIRFDHNWCFYHCHHHHEKGWCCWWWKWWSKFAIAEWQRKTKFTILSNFKQSCAMIVQWWGKLCKVLLPDEKEKIWSNFKCPSVQTVQRCNRCKKPKVPKVNQVVGETHQETNIPPNDTSSSSPIIVVIIVFDVVVVVVVVDVVVIFHLSSPHFRSCTLVDEQNSVR